MTISIQYLQNSVERQRKKVTDSRSELQHQELLLRVLIDELERRVSPENRVDFSEFITFCTSKDESLAQRLETCVIAKFDQKGLEILIDSREVAIFEIMRGPIERMLSEWSGISIPLQITRKQ